jgi:hypothetical protein
MSQPFSPNSGLPDLGAMMFPSGDPFAYPNQPMTEFDNIKQENIGSMKSSRAPPMFLSNGTSGPGIYDDLEGQLFGPLPPYLLQGQQPFDMTGQMGAGSNVMSSVFNPQEMSYPASAVPDVDLDFDGIFSGSGDRDDWNNTVTDQRFR